MSAVRSTVRSIAFPIFVRGAALAAVALAACSQLPGEGPPTATAQLAPTAGSRIAGSVEFSGAGDRVSVHARVSGLAPGREHGFHVHERGDCSAEGESAGGHYNPDGKQHGAQHAEHHAGDMPSLRADASGVADMRFTLTGVSVATGARSLVGRAVIVHAQPDDYASQPAGNSGARLACGVIVAASGMSFMAPGAPARAGY